MANVVTITPTGEDTEKIHTNERITVETPSGQVHISHDPVQGLFVTVRGEKETITVKFNSKAVV